MNKTIFFFNSLGEHQIGCFRYNKNRYDIDVQDYIVAQHYTNYTLGIGFQITWIVDLPDYSSLGLS